MVTMSVIELTGAALDWAVAVALGWECERPQDCQFIDNYGDRRLVGYYGYGMYAKTVANWAHCGPLIDQHSAIYTLCNGQIRAEILGGVGLAENHKVAICRAVVAAKLGNTLEIPQELLE